MKCSDCGRDIEDTTLEGVCAERKGHEARCICPERYDVRGYQGILPSSRCPIHGVTEVERREAEARSAPFARGDF